MRRVEGELSVQAALPLLVRTLRASRRVVAVVGSMPRFVRLVFARIGLLALSGDRRDAEILALRHQILVLKRQVARPRFTDANRTILAVLSQALDRRRGCPVVRGT